MVKGICEECGSDLLEDGTCSNCGFVSKKVEGDDLEEIPVEREEQI